MDLLRHCKFHEAPLTASPVPVLLEVGVAHGGPGADAEVVVEAALGLAGQHAVVVLQTRVAAGHQPAVVVTLHPGHTAMVDQ